MHGDRHKQNLPRSDFDFDLGLRFNLNFKFYIEVDLDILKIGLTSILTNICLFVGLLIWPLQAFN